MPVALEILNNTRCRLVGLKKKVAGLLDEALAMDIPGSRFNPRVRSGMWDGKRHLFDKKRHTFPKGLVHRITALLEEAGVCYRIHDLRKILPDRPKLERLTKTMLHGDEPGTRLKLRSYQVRAARKSLKKRCGILWLATNAGKTEVACAMMMVLKEQRCLFVVHKKGLLAQARQRIAKRFGIIEQHIGVIGGGIFNPQHITVATIQTLTRRYGAAKQKIINNYLKTIRQLYVDEGHHTQATTWYRLLQKIPAPYRYILSGTPFNVNGLLVEAAVGPVVARIKNKTLIKMGVSAKPTIRLVECDSPQLSHANTVYADIYHDGIVHNEHRNRLIAKESRRLSRKGKATMILVSQLWHGDLITQQLQNLGIKSLFVHGQMPQDTVERYTSRFERGKVPVLIASPIFDEGVDVPAIQALIIADGGKSVRAVLQKIGRGLRKKKKGKNELAVIDFADFTHPILASHSQDRLSIYENEGFRITT